MLRMKLSRGSVRYLTGLVLAALLGLGSLSSADLAGSAQGETECTVTVAAGQSVQEAIDEAQEGAVICLGGGTWEENLEIAKPLTLRGTGAEETVVQAAKEGHPVISIGSSDQAQALSVRVEGLKITGAYGGCEDELAGVCAHGLLIYGSAEAEITDNIIESNEACGISSRSSGEIRGQGNRLSANGADLCGNITGTLRAPVGAVAFASRSEELVVYPGADLQEAIDSLLPGGRLIMRAGEYVLGVTIDKEVYIEVEGVELKSRSPYAPAISLVRDSNLVLIVRVREASLEGGIIGLWLGGNARATISQSIFSGSKLAGIALMDSSYAEIISSTIERNEHYGILLLDEAEALIEGNRIINNGGYGVALGQEPCCATGKVFSGRVSGKGNTIPGPGEPDGNGKGTICPSELQFLMTEEGGTYP